MKKVVVTGGSGKLGQWIIKDLLANGYQAVNIDNRHPEEELVKTVIVNLQDLGETFYAVKDADAVIHMAAIPNPNRQPDEVVFKNNVMSTYNILEACSTLGIKKVVLGSSEASYGICNAPIAPQYVPLDEEHPQLPWDCYGLSKIVNEETAKSFARKSDMQIVAMRLGNVITPEMYDNFKGFVHNSARRAHLLWSYIDARDAATACRLAIEKEGLGYTALNIAADNSSMDIVSSELIAKEYPSVTDIRSDISEYQTLLSNKKAKELLDWQPVYNWRNCLPK